MQERLVIVLGIKILDQKNRGWVQRNPSASLRVKEISFKKKSKLQKNRRKNASRMKTAINSNSRKMILC